MTSLDRTLSGPVEINHLGLQGRSFTKELDVTIKQWRGLLDLAGDLKAERAAGREYQRLSEKNLALIFAKSSTRTRCAFEVAAHEQGAHVTYLDPSGSQMGHKESVKDTGRVLGRMFDGIEYRGFSQASVEELVSSSGEPVWNGLTDEWHPTQSLCDMLTMLEHTEKPANEISFAYCGDAHNNTANSLLVAAAMMGMDVRMVSPMGLRNPDSVVATAQEIATRTGATILQTTDVSDGVKGVDFIYTDVWLSMGEPESAWDERIALLSAYQVNAEMITLTGNPDVKFMHCLPAFHDRKTEVGDHIFQRTGLTCLEVTDDVFESTRSIVFDQAENRMHTIKAVLVATLETR
ncbi:MAG: argF [Aeromicrobium sp.]|nr:argF [Aeromicrobium sp.]